MRFLAVVFFVFACFSPVRSQEIVHRLILIGDAGEINPVQQSLILDAAGRSIAGKTTAFFLGDNIYPRGMSLSGQAEIHRDAEILRSQYQPFRKAGVPVFFIPGNHDWDNSGKLGRQKVRALNEFIEAQHDSSLNVIPRNACPDPVAIPMGANVVLIAYDSEWWLYPHDKENAQADCHCDTEAEVLEQLQQLLCKYKDKVVLVAAHHPLRSYGSHGGRFSWKDHLFPLTNVNKHWYLPLPLVGSLYPLLRGTLFLGPEDLAHPAYRHLSEQVESVFDGFPNKIFLAGHDHGLQLIDDDGLHVISGAGSKKSFVKKGRGALFAKAQQGFTVLDVLSDKTSRLTFYSYQQGKFVKAYTYDKHYLPLPTLLKQDYGALLNSDSVTLAAHAGYDRVSGLHRRVFGENYRKEWAAPTRLPVFHLSTLHGGLRPLQRGGGMQTISLRLADASGREWVMRGVNKSPRALLPAGLMNTFAEDLVDDYMSVQHPYSALLVPPLATAANVPHANPTIGVVAPDTILNTYNQLMAGTLVLLEEREPLGKSDNSIKALANLVKDNDNTINAQTFVRAMLLDLLIGDWDRHEDQWRWKNTDLRHKQYLPVARDRDQAIKHGDGIVPALLRQPWVMPTFQNFDSTITSVKYSLYKHRFVNALPEFQFSEEQWMSMARQFVSMINDKVIDSAVAQLPLSSQRIRGPQIATLLKKRRDNIPDALRSYYRFIQRIVDVRLSDKREYVLLEDAPGGQLKLSVFKVGKEGLREQLLVDKVFDPKLTRELRIYLQAGNDSVIFKQQHSDIKIRLIGGEGSKFLEAADSICRIHYYGRTRKNVIAGNSYAIRARLCNDSLTTAFVPVNLYDKTLPLATLGFNRDDKLILGAGIKHIQQGGFRKSPYTASQQFMIAGSPATGAFKASLAMDWLAVVGAADVVVDAFAWVPNNNNNFFGIGNASRYDRSQSISYYRSRYTLLEINPSLRWKKNNELLKVGLSAQYYSMDEDPQKPRYLFSPGAVSTYDSLSLTNAKVFAGLTLSYTMDNRDNPVLTTRGGTFQTKALVYKGISDLARSFGRVEASFSFYVSLNRSRSLVFSNRTGGGTIVGDYAYFQSLFLGAQENLRGYRQYRFAGRSMLYNNAELRARLLQIKSYILPGELGLSAFYDAGRVWAARDDNDTIHQGLGGGLYYCPANLLLVQAQLGHSKEGWYPAFSLGARF